MPRNTIFCRRSGWHSFLTTYDGNTLPRDWLQDRGSLTQRLQSMGCFSISVIKQKLARPTIDEAAALGLSCKGMLWVREVALRCDGAPVVFAHTVLTRQPRGPLTGWLQRLGERSLGALLFSHVGFSRGIIEYKRINVRHELFHPAVRAMQLGTSTQALWARRSRFSFGLQSVLVTEIFSPALNYAKPNTNVHNKASTRRP